jgi:hypothetical protein
MAEQQCNGWKEYRSRRRRWDTRRLGDLRGYSARTGDSDGLCMTRRWLYADSGHALPARVAPVPVSWGSGAAKHCGRARVRKRTADGHGTRIYACDNKLPIADHPCLVHSSARGEHTERCADRPSLRIPCSPTSAERQGTTRRASKAWCRTRKMSRGMPWEWRRACGGISTGITLQSMHFHIKRTRERRGRDPKVRPRTTREAGAAAPPANAVPLRLLDAAVVAALTDLSSIRSLKTRRPFKQGFA